MKKEKSKYFTGIRVNRIKRSFLYKIADGLLQIIDGLVVILSLGYLCSDFHVSFLFWYLLEYEFNEVKIKSKKEKK